MEPESRVQFAFRFCIGVSQIALTFCSLEFNQMIVNETVFYFRKNTLLRKQGLSVAYTNRLLLLREINTVNCENHNVNTFCGQNAEFLCVKQVVYLVTTVF